MRPGTVEHGVNYILCPGQIKIISTIMLLSFVALKVDKMHPATMRKFIASALLPGGDSP